MFDLKKIFNKTKQQMTYKNAGVDIDAADDLIERIKPLAKKTLIPEIISDIGGFAALCNIPSDIKNPVLVSGTDGVGTKLELAFKTGIHNTIGIDLVAMCVNDIITTGARPLFFLDYFATSNINVNIAEQVISGIANGCTQAKCALIGGETAELPGMYKSGTYDLAGFAVGVVDRNKIINGNNCVENDIILGVASNFLHSNGYSLARLILDKYIIDNHVDSINANELYKLYLTPTLIYVDAIEMLKKYLPENSIKAICHITGGGIPGNLPRVLPDNISANINFSSYKRPEVFNWLAENGNVEEDEMRKTFNLGIGLCIILSREYASKAIDILQQSGNNSWILGCVFNSNSEERVIFN